MISKIHKNQYFDIEKNLTSNKDFENAFKRRKNKATSRYSSDFSENLTQGKKANCRF
ncbi:hypothetical protein MASR1M29_01920 [Cloacibacterium normanense]